MELSTDYIIQQFYTYCKRPSYKKGQGVYNAECPVCKEGTSAGLKKRLFYFPGEHYFYCFNCSKSWNEFNWLKEVTGESTTSILKNSKTHIIDITNIDDISIADTSIHEQSELPENVFDITCQQDIKFYKTKYNNKSHIIDTAIAYCQNRRLFTAINRPKSLFFTLFDRIHYNRLIIPFYNEFNKLYTYQSRSLDGDTYPKYITKVGDKCLYGENNIKDTLSYIFVLEGPIDAMFITNGVAVGGSTITEKQTCFLQKQFDKQLIYIFDNDKNNLEMHKTVLKAIENNKKIFIWPKELRKFKDINEVCCHYKLDHIDPKFITDNSFSGLEARVKFLTSIN